MDCPRVLISGTGSGCGKTTAVCALLWLFKERGVGVSALKCGPDYIDPMFHRAVLGVPSGNLDPFFCDGGLLRSTLAAHAGAELTLLEGAMGYFDGTGESGTEYSAYTVARATRSPVVLVVNARGASTSVLAVLEGFLRFVPDGGIRGVILNNVSPGTYEDLKALIRRRFGDKIAPLGYIPRLPEECILGSRHLGLVTPEELSDAGERLRRIGELCRETLDLNGLLALGRTAPELVLQPAQVPKLPPVTLAVSRDAAFSFLYEDTLRLFEKLGAEIRFFSPLLDEPVPEGASGLYLPGGYPELYADTLEKNRRAAGSVRDAVASGMPTIAECGGFQYLGEALDGRKMCGVLPVESANTGHLVRFGYVTLTAKGPGLFGDAGLTLPAHEFHYYDSTARGAGFTAQKINGKSWDCGVYTDTLYAGYPHLYLPAYVPAAESFLQKCAEFKEKQKCL